MPLLSGTERHMPRAVCFDLYGTLIDISIDTNLDGLWESLFHDFTLSSRYRTPAELHARYDALVQRDRQRNGEAFVLDSGLFSDLLGVGPGDIAVREFGREFRRLSTVQVQLRPYAAELLQRMREYGAKLAIVSNTEQTVTGYDLDQLDLVRHFDTVVLSSVVGARKPDAAIFQVAMDRLGVAADECVFVGDDYVCDFRGAEAVGMRPVLLCTGRHPTGVPCVPAEVHALIEAICSS